MGSPPEMLAVSEALSAWAGLIISQKHLHICMEVDVAVLGGGFAGVYCTKALAGARSKGFERIALIANENYMVFQPMLPEVTGGTISPLHVISPLRLLCRNAQVLKSEVQEIRLKERTLILSAGAFSDNLSINYRHLVLALGSEVDLSRVPGMSEHAFLMRNVGDAMYLRTTIIGRIEEASLESRTEVRQRLLTFVVVGGGYSGVETAGHILDLFQAVYRFYPGIQRDELVVYLVHSRDYLLQTLTRKLGDYAARQLQKRGLRLLLNERVKAMTADRVYLDSGKVLESNTVVATIGNGPNHLVRRLCEDNGFEAQKGQVVTDQYCRVKGQTNLWAAGDCAAVPLQGGGFCPENAQFAMRQGKLIGQNILRGETQKQLQPFTYKGLGEMATIGHRVAVADILGVNFSGFIAWWIWRSVYLAKLPRLDRKIRVVLDWTLDLFFPRDINHLSPRFSTLASEMHLERGDVLFEKGEPAFSFYIVKEGALELSGGPGPDRRIGEGDYFGESALLDGGTWMHQARAVEPTRLVALPASVFHQISSGAGSLAKFFRKSAAKYRLRQTMDLLGRRMPEGFMSRPVAEFMSAEVFKLTVQTRVREALDLARRHPRSSYPVVDATGRFLGVLEREDFYDFVKKPGTTDQTTLEGLGLSSVPVCDTSVSLEKFLPDMMRSGSNKAIVIDEKRSPVGVITILDVLAASCAEDFRSTKA